MRNMTPSKMAEVCGGICYGLEEDKNREVCAITNNSKEAERDGMYIAFQGERVDGNSFIKECYEKGVLCCMSEYPPEKNSCQETDGAYIQVESCAKAVQDIAVYYREQYDIKIVGITGSVGKTSTKEMIASVLSQKYNTLKTEGNYNNELGVPLTLFRLRASHEAAVVEMGISDFGEMDRLSRMVKPDICVITNIGQCHLENLGDRDGVLKAKTEIFHYRNKTGAVILNGDDDKLITLDGDKEIAPLFFGKKEGLSYRVENVRNYGLDGIDMDIFTPQGTISAHVAVPGEHMLYNAMAGAAVGQAFGLSLEEIKEGIAGYRALAGRGNVIKTSCFTVLDDCYNANPVSMQAGIDVLADTKTGRRVAVLGDMFELGEQEREFHSQIGAYVGDKNIEVLIAVGNLSVHLKEAAIEHGVKQVYYFRETEEAVEQLSDILEKGDAILVKASHGMHFENIVQHITQNI